MNGDEFKKYGRELLDYIVNYKENVSDYTVMPVTDAGYLHKLLPENAPTNPENMGDVLSDFDRFIMPGVAHWNHPQFHAYFPSGNAYANIFADALSTAIGAIGFSWNSCPAMTELETIMMDWAARALGLPEQFMADKTKFVGGGCLQGSASDATLVSAFAARARTIRHLRGGNNDLHDSVYLPQLVVYASREAHSSVEKACMMALMRLRTIETDDRGVMRIDLIEKAIEADVEAGLTPCLVVATLGTTGLTSFDNVDEIGQMLEKINATIPIWFHVDGAYGGSAFLCPEFRYLMKGLERADSFVVNPNKLMLGAYDMSLHFVKNVEELKLGLTINPAYLVVEYNHERQMDYRHYGTPLSRRFRALKLWFLFRSYGISGLQKYIRNVVVQAKYFEKLLRADGRFQIANEVVLGLVCFKFSVSSTRTLDKANEMTLSLLEKMNESTLIHMIPTRFKDAFIIRMSINHEHMTAKDVEKSMSLVKRFADEVDTLSKRETFAKKRPSKFTFTRSVSKEVFERQTSQPSLTDGCTPLLVMDTDDILASLNKATRRSNLKNSVVDEEQDVSN